MTAASPASASAKAQPSATQSMPPARYVRVPQRLIAAAAYHPLQVGVYSLVARLFLVAQSPVPLSAADITRYDPSLSRGAAQRVLSSLVDGGWLIASERTGQKSTYVPAWGNINGAPLAWRIGALCLDRPRHVRAVCLDLRLLDLFLGKLAPHARRAAIITRYVTSPLLTLADVGSYALLLGGLSGATPNLVAWGLSRDELPLPLPGDDAILAQASQRRLFDGDNIALTTRGLQKAGLVGPRTSADSAQPLFFVPSEVIADWPTRTPTNLIGQTERNGDGFVASQSQEMGLTAAHSGITWESMGAIKNQVESPPTPPTGRPGGGELLPSAEIKSRGRGTARKTERQKRVDSEPALPLPDTEAAQALIAINVLPEQVAELADAPINVVQDAIRDGKARPYVRDLAGWVVTLIRAQRDHGWKISPPPPRSDSPEALHEAFARYAAEQEASLCEGADVDLRSITSPVLAQYEHSSQPIRLWNDIQATLKLQLSRQEFNTWIRPAVLHSVEGSVATITAPSQLVKEAIESKYLGLLRDLLTMQIGEAVKLQVILNGAQHDGQAVPPSSNQSGTVTLSSHAPPTPTATPSSRPVWISQERWETLPAMLRAALIGSTLEHGQVQAGAADGADHPLLQ